MSGVVDSIRSTSKSRGGADSRTGVVEPRAGVADRGRSWVVIGPDPDEPDAMCESPSSPEPPRTERLTRDHPRTVCSVRVLVLRRALAPPDGRISRMTWRPAGPTGVAAMGCARGARRAGPCEHCSAWRPRAGGCGIQATAEGVRRTERGAEPLAGLTRGRRSAEWQWVIVPVNAAAGELPGGENAGAASSRRRRSRVRRPRRRPRHGPPRRRPGGDAAMRSG